METTPLCGAENLKWKERKKKRRGSIIRNLEYESNASLIRIAHRSKIAHSEATEYS